MEKHIYRYLQKLKGSDFRIVKGEPNIIGWKVKSEHGFYIGEICDLLFDPESRSVRYLVIDLANNGMDLGHKKVMIPIGTAHLHTSDDEVVLPNIDRNQLNSLPAYNEDATVPATEVQIREVISPPTTKREREIEAFNQNDFYTHEHFNKERFYQRGGIQSNEFQNRDLAGDRTEQEETIHRLVENSEQQDHHAADHETGSGTHHNEGKH